MDSAGGEYSSVGVGVIGVEGEQEELLLDLDSALELLLKRQQDVTRAASR
jgi:hypothetical protein